MTKNQSDTQKHIDLLGNHIAKSKSTSLKPTEDPFITHRGVLSRLDGQVQEENAHHSTLIALQNECAQFEAKIVTAIQDMVGQMGTLAASQAQNLTNTHQQLTQNSSRISPSAEWNGFVARDRSLADPNAAPRTAKTITFAGSDHETTKPVLEGDLLRKGTVIKKYNSAYYVLTPSGFLHEFKSKSFETDPEPAWSLDLKSSTLGAHSAPNSGKAKWTIAGKTKGLMSSKHDFQFQATSYEDMLEWWSAIRKFAHSSSSTEEVADDSDSEPTSPVIPSQATEMRQNRNSTIDERANTGAYGAETSYGNTNAAHDTVPLAFQGTGHHSTGLGEFNATYPQSGAGYAEPASAYNTSGEIPSAAHGAA